jgi:aspartate racemase
MKHIGIASVSPEGAALCYTTICSEQALRTGSQTNPPITIHQPSFGDIVAAQEADDWDTVTSILTATINTLALAGADVAVIPANSVHFVIDDIQQDVSIPVLSLIDVVVSACQDGGYTTVGVLGVGITMAQGLFDDALREIGINTIVPSQEDQESLDRLIYTDLVTGVVTPDIQSRVYGMIDRLRNQGAEAVILGCTELPLVVEEGSAAVPTVDTTRLLAVAALNTVMK